jgi:hypothetical protein
MMKVISEWWKTNGPGVPESPHTPFLFSSLALDISLSRVRRLIQAFLLTCVSFPAPDVEYTWREEARFAAPPELAMCLRWGLARVLRVSGGNAVHGLISELCKQFFFALSSPRNIDYHL